RLFWTGLVLSSAMALVGTSLLLAGRPDWVLGVRPDIAPDVGGDYQLRVLGGLAFWTVIVALASALPVRMPRGTVVSVSIAPIVAVMFLGGPAAAGWVAAIGTTELREVRGRVPWYGSLVN